VLPVVEKQWSDLQSYERRVAIYCTNLDLIMRQSRIPHGISESFREDSLDVARDFQHLRLTLRDIQRRVELLTSSITGLVGISGNRQAIGEQMLAPRRTAGLGVLCRCSAALCPGFGDLFCLWWFLVPRSSV